MQVQRYEALRAEPVHPAQGLFRWSAAAVTVPATAAATAAATTPAASTATAAAAAAPATTPAKALFVLKLVAPGLSAISQDALRRTCRALQTTMPKPKFPIQGWNLFNCCGGFGNAYLDTEWWQARDLTVADLARVVSMPCIENWMAKQELFAGRRAPRFSIHAGSGLMYLDCIPMHGLVDLGSAIATRPFGDYAANYLVCLARAVFGRGLPDGVCKSIVQAADAMLLFHDDEVVSFRNVTRRGVKDVLA